MNLLTFNEADGYRDFGGDRGYVPFVGPGTGMLYFLDTPHIAYERYVELVDPEGIGSLLGVVNLEPLYDALDDARWRRAREPEPEAVTA